MTNTPNLQKAPNGYFYLRSQRDGKDRRISLKTKDLATAKLAAAIMHVTLTCMTINPNKIKDWTLESDGQNIKITTENNDADRASALEAVKVIAARHTQENDSYHSVIQNKLTITLGEAIAEYKPSLAKTDIPLKTQRMTKSVLADLVERVGTAFNMAEISDEIVEEKWLK